MFSSTIFFSTNPLLLLKIKQMKISKVFLCPIIIILLNIGFLSGQTAVDALRYSELFPSGTARMVGVGGAMSSLGGDFGALSINPAGLAVYRKSEFVFTPSVKFTNVESILNEANETTSKRTKFGLENIGLVFYKDYNKPKFKSFNLGIGINRLVNFNRKVEYSGNTPGSITNGWQSDAQGLFFDDLDPFTSRLASESGAIFTLDGQGNDNWFSDFDTFEDLPINRRETITTSGGVSELLFALGANISHKLYLGLSLNLPIVRFEELREYEEDDEMNGDVIPFFRNLTYDQRISTTGVGIGFKAGAIYRITNEIRLGASIHSPTRFSFSDDFNSSTTYFFIDEDDSSLPLIDGEGTSPVGSFEYALNTPWRFGGGLSVVLKKFGFVSVDVEYLDYSSLEYDFTTEGTNTSILIAQRNVNDEIMMTFTDRVNLKLGAEYLLNKFRLRAGYGIYGTPFSNDDNSQNVLSLGAGFRGESAYIDLAFRTSRLEEGFSPYSSPNTFNQQVISDIKANSLLMTIGYRF